MPARLSNLNQLTAIHDTDLQHLLKSVPAVWGITHLRIRLARANGVAGITKRLIIVRTLNTCVFSSWRLKI